MKKYLVVLVVVLSVLILAAPAFAVNIPWNKLGTMQTPVHYDFTLTTTEGCAACHVTHTATVAKLLYGDYKGSEPVTQTGFCYVCHAGIIASPYDVEHGIISPDLSATETDSWAGFFGFDGGGATSVHGVEDDVTPGATAFNAGDIPGNATAGDLTQGFKCASCHDPHGGDLPNDRLLKEKPLGTANAAVDTVDFEISHATMAVVDYAYDAAGNDGLNDWCGQCHGKFNAEDNDGREGFASMYRHPMGVDINTAGLVSVQVYLGNKGATASGSNLLNCLTCHKAHGTDVQANNAGWPREGGSTSPASSALLRLNKRGVCYDCHGAATRNLEDYTFAGPAGNNN